LALIAEQSAVTNGTWSVASPPDTVMPLMNGAARRIWASTSSTLIRCAAVSASSP
jgi:hypothetical protein